MAEDPPSLSSKGLLAKIIVFLTLLIVDFSGLSSAAATSDSEERHRTSTGEKVSSSTISRVTALGYLKSSDPPRYRGLLEIEGLFPSSEDPDLGIVFVVVRRSRERLRALCKSSIKLKVLNNIRRHYHQDHRFRTIQALFPLRESLIDKRRTKRPRKALVCFRNKTLSTYSSHSDDDEDSSILFLLPPLEADQIINEAADESDLLRQTQVLSRNARETEETEINDSDDGGLSKHKLIALKLREVSKNVQYTDYGSISALEYTEINLFLFGFGMTNNSEIKLTTHPADFGDACASEKEGSLTTATFNITVHSEFEGQVIIPGLPTLKAGAVFYVCLKVDGDQDFVHQGRSKSLQIETYALLLPIWILIIFIVVLLCLSGLFSGLNLGLMALDQTELKIVQNTGTPKEREYANKIAPIRAHGNFLLCSLLLGNVLVNNTLTILLDTLSSGLVAVIGATMGIVVFGEIIPQAICSRHGLAVGAYTIWLTKFFMLLTFPLSFPISKLLDKILGSEMGTVYNRERLMELLKVTKDYNDLEKDEVNIVTGALAYKQKTVRNVMTPLEDCYLLPLNTYLNFETVSEIREQGYSRIPVYDGKRNNIVHILFAKDLMFIDPDDNMPLSMLCEFYNNDVNFVFHDTPLNIMFNEFKSGDKGHMAFVQDINTEGDGDPFYETCGLVTLEDIIEEIIQQEIVDETDIIIDNKTKKRRKREGWKGKEGNFPLAAGNTKDTRQVQLSPQLTLAVFQYLTTSVVPFKPKTMAESILKKLLMMDVFREVKIKYVRNDSDKIIVRGKAIDFFILIVEGRVEVNIGKEELIFEGGPFTYFGIQTLNQVLSDENINPPGSPTNNNNNKVTTPGSVDSSSASENHQQQVNNPGGGGGFRSSIRKASTHNSLEHAMKRNNSITTVTNEPVATSSSAAPTPTSSESKLFVPDYTVKAVTDILYLKVTRSAYVGAIKATQMSKKQNLSGEFNDKLLDKLLEKGEDEGGDPQSPENSSEQQLRKESIRNSLNLKKLVESHSKSLKEEEREDDDKEEEKEEEGNKTVNGPIKKSLSSKGGGGGEDSASSKEESSLNSSAVVIAVKGETNNGSSSLNNSDNRPSLLRKDDTSIS